ncbi:hypothetical protein AB0G79_27530 [Streptomyces sp. NPDC020807]|uniref:hypothetical protein n=1 Tax=Streptomyces sp. NPDC020807 TaxID=3155119 RepID=UPI0033EE6751
MTRQLCAHVHLDEGFAHDVDVELTADRMAALGLPLGIHLVALARHARQAARRSERRDRLLSPLNLAFWAGWAVLVWGLVSGNDAALTLGLVLVVGSAVAAFWIVRAALSGSWRAAQDVYWGDRPAETLADPVERDAETRLTALAKANVVPYTVSAATDPFVGSGSQLKDVVWQPIDVSRPADDPANPGRKLAIKPFDAVDLHTFVAKEMANIAGLEGLRARNRMYVLGDHVQLLADDLLEPPGRPRAQISADIVRSAVVNPGAGMRTFLTLERISDGGRMIVSMMLRARLYHPSLSWEVLVYAIPPLSPVYSLVATLPGPGFERGRRLFGASWKAWGKTLRCARRRNADRRAGARKRARDLRELRKELAARRLIYDYGATGSIRHSVSDWKQVTANDSADSRDYLYRLQGGVLIATEKFLKAHHVDTSSYDQAVQVISNQTYNVNGPVSGSSFGNNNQTNNYGQGNNPGGPQGGQPGGGPPGGPGQPGGPRP